VIIIVEKLHSLYQFIVYIIVPAKVQNLQCSGNSDDMSLSISWGEPMAQGTVAVGYSVECRRVNQLPSRELMTVPLSPAYDEGLDETQAQVTQGLGMNTTEAYVHGLQLLSLCS
jgi:hypothetical protein